MLFGYTLIQDNNKGQKVELALIPDRPGIAPTPIYTLPFTDAAVCFASPEEAFLVKPAEEAGLIIQAQKPGKIYLTPNRPERPGYSVSKIKILRTPEGGLKCFYDREKGWEEFLPNSKDY
jgi:hypothetical protein